MMSYWWKQWLKVAYAAAGIFEQVYFVYFCNTNSSILFHSTAQEIISSMHRVSGYSVYLPAIINRTHVHGLYTTEQLYNYVLILRNRTVCSMLKLKTRPCIHT